MDAPKTPHSKWAPQWVILQAAGCLILTFWTHLIPPLVQAQDDDNQAALIRLRDVAEDAMSMDDPQSAALNSGKAALMAALMAEQETQPVLQKHWRSLEALLRAQEQTYRAIALFQQSGEHIPASSGVCQTLTLASSQREKAQTVLPSSVSEGPLFQDLPMELHEWKETIEELQTDFECSKNAAG